jgi:hypothetical protein
MFVHVHPQQRSQHCPLFLTTLSIVSHNIVHCFSQHCPLFLTTLSIVSHNIVHCFSQHCLLFLTTLSIVFTVNMQKVTLLAQQMARQLLTFSIRASHTRTAMFLSRYQVIFQSENKFVLPAVSSCDGRQLYCLLVHSKLNQTHEASYLLRRIIGEHQYLQ